MDLNENSQATASIALDLDDEFHHIAYRTQHHEFSTDLHDLIESLHSERNTQARRRRRMRRQLFRTSSQLDAALQSEGNRQTERNSQVTISRMQTSLLPSLQRSNSKTVGTGGNSEISQNIECAICLDTCRELTSTLCGHVFCLECIQAVIQSCRKCPLCKHQLSLNSIHRLYI